MSLEVVCAGICPTCSNWDAVWRGVGVAGDTTYLHIDCDDVCDPPPSWLQARLQRWKWAA